MSDDEDEQPTPSPALRKSARPPTASSLENIMVESWKRFKKRWNNYVMLSGLDQEDMTFQVAQLENCLADDALKTLEGFQFETDEDNRTTEEILDAFETFAISEVNKTLERFKFGKRQQLEGEAMDKFVADLRIMMKSCSYCNTCAPSILRDRVVLGITSNDIREVLLKERNLTLEKCIDTCKAMESASAYVSTLRPETVNRVQERPWESEMRECNYCPHTHKMKKEECPAWGKKCKKCGKRNHHETKCYADKSTPETSSSNSKYASKKPYRKKSCYVNHLEEEES